MSPRTLSNRKKPAGHSPPDKKATLADELAVWVKCNSRQGSRLARAGPARGANQPRTQENLSLLCQLSENAREDRHPSGLGPTVHPLLRCVSSTSPAGKRACPDPSGPLAARAAGRPPGPVGRHPAARRRRSAAARQRAGRLAAGQAHRGAGPRPGRHARLAAGAAAVVAAPGPAGAGGAARPARCGPGIAPGPGPLPRRPFRRRPRRPRRSLPLESAIAPAGPGRLAGRRHRAEDGGGGGRQPGPGLARVAVIGPPIDLARSAALLAQPGNRLYESISSAR